MNPTAQLPPSYRDLRRELAFAPESVAVFFDHEIESLLQHSIQDKTLSSYLLGEALLRSWLYAGSQESELILQQAGLHLSSGLFEFFQDHILKHADAIKKEGMSPNELPPDRTGLNVNGHDAAIWRFLFKRIQSYRRADGLIPVINTANPADALLLPFQIFSGATQLGEILDMGGQSISNWASCIQGIHHLFDYQPRIVLSCHCGQRASLLEGHSMILPICLAIAKKSGDLLDYSMWDVIATGALAANGALEGVDGLAGKAEIARRVSARLFICPDTPDNPGGCTLSLPLNTPLDDCLRLIDEELTHRGLGNLNSRQALVKLKELKNDIHTGLLRLEKASPRLDRYENALKDSDPDDEYTRECRCIILLIRGAMANHAGDPLTAKNSLDQALDMISKHNLDMEHHYHAIANAVVSLTDIGLLDDAETEGRTLLKLVETMQSSADAKTRARMTACGALGGQPLLQKALQFPALADESLCLLTKAYKFALKLEDRKEQARDAAQIALWHALIKPETATPEIDKAERLLIELHTDGESSLRYLQSYRFLAAYRLFLLQNQIPPEFEHWPLPKDGDWVQAVTLKYRGALHAEAGRKQQAQLDFQQAFEQLEAGNMPLLRFIGATTALQAARSLCESLPDASREFAKKAHEIFVSLAPVLHGIHRDPAWKASSLALAENQPPSENPQTKYRY